MCLNEERLVLDFEARGFQGLSAAQLIAFVASHLRRLAIVWTLFDPMPCLSTYYAFASGLVLQALGVCHRASLEGGKHLGKPCCFPLIPFLGLGLPLLFSVIKGIGGCLDHLI